MRPLLSIFRNPNSTYLGLVSEKDADIPQARSDAVQLAAQPAEDRVLGLRAAKHLSSTSHFGDERTKYPEILLCSCLYFVRGEGKDSEKSERTY